MVTLKKEDFENGIAIVRKAANTDILDDINRLAAVIAQEGDNELKETLLEQCKKFQAVYNDSFKPPIDELIALYNESFEYAEFLEKQSVGELGTTDASFSVSRLNPGSVNV